MLLIKTICRRGFDFDTILMCGHRVAVLHAASWCMRTVDAFVVLCTLAQNKNNLQCVNNV